MATTTYVTRAAFKEDLLIDPTDNSVDATIDRVIAGASRGIDRLTGRQRFWVDDAPVTRDLSLVGRVTQLAYGEQLLLLNGFDIATSVGLTVSVGQVGGPFTVLDPATLAYWTDEALIDGWPIEGLIQPVGLWNALPGARVRVTARWGWLPTPDDIVQATSILARRLFNRKDSPAGVMGSADWVVNLAKNDPDVVSLTQRFTLAGFG